MELSGKHVLITGAASGIGCAFADALHAQGASVVSIDKQGTIACDGVETIRADITSSSDLTAVFAKWEKPIDILINNAGVMGHRTMLLEATEQDYDLVMNVNVKGAWMVLKHALSHLQPNATVVQVSSRHAIYPPVNPALYTLSKQYELVFAEMLAASYPLYTVKVVCPGPTNTPLFHTDIPKEQLPEKEKFMREPEELAALMVQLLTDDASLMLNYDNVQHTYHFLPKRLGPTLTYAAKLV